MMRAAVASIYGLRKSVDVILLTGDMAESGSIASQSEAFAFVHGKQAPSKYFWQLSDARGRPTLRSSQLPILLMPGNHDRFDGVRRQPGGTTFDRVFAEEGHWTVGQGVQVREIELEVGARLAFVFADFTLRSSDGERPAKERLGRGRVYDAVLSQLKSKTREVRADVGGAIAWAMHFMPGQTPDPSIRLERWELLLDAAKEHGVKLLFCGHTHTIGFSIGRNGDGPLVIRAGSLCAGAPVYGWRRRREPNSMLKVDVFVDSQEIIGVRSSPLMWDGARFQTRPDLAKEWGEVTPLDA